MEGIRLRGHHLLCLPGFRGYGYSREHAERLGEVKKQLWGHPETEVEVVDRPDEVCAACPHLRDSKCVIERGAETRTRRRDRGMLAALGLKGGDRLTWGEVRVRIRERITPEELTRLCSTCRWFSSGYCMEGLKDV